MLVAALLAGNWARLAALGLDPTNPALTLSDVERTVSRLYPVPEITAPALESSLPKGDVVLFDVREREEYDLSHLPGAIHVDPDLDADEFLRLHGKQLAGRRAVFYCAVGVRSGIMVDRLNKAAAKGAANAANLRGGIFRWHAEHRPITSDSGPATRIHGYDASWQQLLNRTLDQQK